MLIEQAPLGVYETSRDFYRPIPASTQPILVSDKTWRDLQKDARHILIAAEKICKYLQRNLQDAIDHPLFSGLSPLEKQAARGAFGANSGLATARLDLFFDDDDLSVIEINSTIPAMQAYSDMIRSAYFSARQAPSHPIAGSNSKDLLISLLQHYEQTGGTNSKPRLAIVARRGDSQRAELLWLQTQWQEEGYETWLVTPDEIELKDQQVWVQSTPMDFIYRHIFVHRLAPDSPFAIACSQSQVYRVFNPIAAHLETKSLFAELSRLAADDALSEEAGLNAEEQSAVQRRVTWSRILDQGPTLSPDGERIDDFMLWLKHHSQDVVIKSSLGYGGNGVVLGDSFASSSTQERIRQLFQLDHELSWEQFLDLCLKSGPGQWIVQRKMSGRRQRHTFLAGGQWVEQDTYIDCSIFSNSGVPHVPSGGAVRFSSDAIVNIGQGGGLAPLLLASEI